jgi:hypothetical protein
MPVISFKVSAADARTIRARAHARKQTVSAYLRDRALNPKASPNRVVVRTHRVSGLTYDAAAGSAVTEEEIRAALADFP